MFVRGLGTLSAPQGTLSPSSLSARVITTCSDSVRPKEGHGPDTRGERRVRSLGTSKNEHTLLGLVLIVEKTEVGRDRARRTHGNVCRLARGKVRNSLANEAACSSQEREACVPGKGPSLQHRAGWATRAGQQGRGVGSLTSTAFSGHKQGSQKHFPLPKF